MARDFFVPSLRGMKMLAGIAICRGGPVTSAAGDNHGNQTAFADTYLAASYEAWQQGRFSGSSAAAREALKLQPGLALAWNNMAASYNALGLFDDGMRSAQEAGRLQPDFALAKNNLEWAKVNLDSTPEGYITRSLIYFQQGKYGESLKAAQAALHLRPDYAEAWKI